MIIALLATAAAAAADPDIVVTASLEPVAAEESPASATVIDEKRIEALGVPFVSDLARLAPGVSVSVSGAQGALTQVRIRGAEANHSLLFVDGIAFNDPAAGNEARFETFAADGLSRVEIVRGPQSALWGSEALGGVIALETADPLSGDPTSGERRIWQPRLPPGPCRGDNRRRPGRDRRQPRPRGRRRDRHFRRRGRRPGRVQQPLRQPEGRGPARLGRRGRRRRPLHPGEERVRRHSPALLPPRRHARFLAREARRGSGCGPASASATRRRGAPSSTASISTAPTATGPATRRSTGPSPTGCGSAAS